VAVSVTPKIPVIILPVALQQLPSSGQTTCYTSAGDIISCAGTGQDGQYGTTPLSYTDNGDGTVTDKNTGLVWQKQENKSGNWYSAAGVYDATYNSTSQSVCGALRTGGFSDWRLPSKMELVSIVNYGDTSPAINPVFTNSNPLTNGYWTATTNSAGPVFAWYVHFEYGAVSNARKDGLQGNSQYSRCVRGQPAAGNLTDNGNGTVSDSKTKLMWQKGGPPLYDLSYTWDGALSYCEGLTDAGYSDWRLPNIKELESLVDDSRNSPPIDTTLFPNARKWKYWSSTTLENYESYAWTVDFTSIGDATYPKKTGYQYYTRCVRGGN
jgi:hypothetical protein